MFMNILYIVYKNISKKHLVHGWVRKYHVLPSDSSSKCIPGVHLSNHGDATRKSTETNQDRPEMLIRRPCFMCDPFCLRLLALGQEPLVSPKWMECEGRGMCLGRSIREICELLPNPLCSQLRPVISVTVTGFHTCVAPVDEGEPSCVASACI